MYSKCELSESNIEQFEDGLLQNSLNFSSGSSGTGSGEPSNSSGNNPEPRKVTGDSDYEDFETESPYHSDSDDNELMKLIYSNDFPNKIKTLNKNDLSLTLSTLGEMKEQYELSKDKIPSAEEQIKVLSKQEALVEEEIGKRLNEDNSKGKEKEK
uniref:Uncharacterized protein n=1 Tax=Madurella mycetomatis TaxID=100816 RepID=I6NM97_9PEZI|nr:hypothetical protein B662_mgp08 [Madurella mycetomatis]AEY94407.1 hypothetical protein [Madurella mycetomatis]